MVVDSVLKYNDMNRLKEPSLHFTIIFNVFVLMTLFNEIFSRKLQNERNCFAGIQNNWMFIGIWIVCFSGQVLIVNTYHAKIIEYKKDFILLDIVSKCRRHCFQCCAFGLGSLDVELINRIWCITMGPSKTHTFNYSKKSLVIIKFFTDCPLST